MANTDSDPDQKSFPTSNDNNTDNPDTTAIPTAVAALSPAVSYHDEQNGVFGCKHYARNCFLKAECCNQWYVCRFCHDETNEFLEQNHMYNVSSTYDTNHYPNNNNDDDDDQNAKPHQINRYATKFVRCMRCGTEQNASSSCIKCTADVVPHGQHGGHGSSSDTSMDDDIDDEDGDVHNDDDDDHVDHTMTAEQKACIDHDHDEGQCACKNTQNCNDENDTERDDDDEHKQRPEQPRQRQPYVFGKYYCNICKFYDNQADKQIFHCPECGLCRIGNKTDFIHCRRCGCCLSYKYYTKHPCIENSLKSDCPICFTYLFKSTDPVTFFMPCGHPIHYECLMQYANVGNWNCPVCRARWHDENAAASNTAAAMKKDNDASKR